MAADYHRKNIRDLLTKGFTEENLRIDLCFDEADFQPLQDRLPQAAGKVIIVQHIVEYAFQQLKVEALLAWAKDRNPARYAEHKPYRSDADAPPDGEPQPLFTGVPAMPAHFVGRDKLLADFVRRLTTGHNLAVAIEGQGGVGKTTLAVALAHHREVLAHFSDGVLWASLGLQGEAMTALAAWAEALGRDVTDIADPEERHEAVKTLIGQRRLLLVIDDAWELEAANWLRCGGPNCCHLLTTRKQDIARKFTGAAQTKKMPVLKHEAAYDLLQTLAPEACAADSPAAQALSRAVGGLPLAIELLGGYLAEPEHSLFPDLSQSAMAELADPHRRLALAQKRLGAKRQAETLGATLKLSLEGLPDSTVSTFYALGAFAPKPEHFSREAAETVTGGSTADLARLVARNLLEFEEDALALHKVLADLARSQPDQAAQARHRDYYLALVNEDREDWRRIKAVYGQITQAWHGTTDPATQLEWIWALQTYQRLQGLWEDQKKWYEIGLVAARTTNQRKDEGMLLNNLGWVYDKLGQREKSLNYYQQVLPTREEADDRAGLATTLNNLGEVYRKLGQTEQALEYHQQALPILEEVGDRAVMATTLNNLGAVYDNLGQREQALAYYQQALPIREEVGDRAGLATTLNNLGLVYDNLGQRQKALAYFQQALPILEEVGDRAGVAQTLNNLGLVYANLGQREQALAYYQQALPIQEEVGDRTGLAVTLNNLGAVYDALGQREQALDYYQQALPIKEEVGDRGGLAVTLNNLGLVYDNLGQRQQALDYYQQALPILEEVGDRAVMATTLNNLGAVYDALGQREQALAYYQQALPIQEEVGDRAGLATTLNNLGVVYNNLGQREKALAYYQQALPIREEVGDRGGLATTLNNLGLVYNALGQREQALAYYQQALPIREEVGDRAGLAVTLSNLGLVYNNLGQREKALAYFQQALPIQEEVGDRGGLATTLSNLGGVYNALGQREKALAYYQQALPILEEVGDKYVESITRYNMALVYRATGRLAEAVAQLERVVELDRLVQHPDLESDMALLAEVEAEMGRDE